MDDSFGLVIDNIVECAISRVGRDPQLCVAVEERNGVIAVSIDDRQGTIPPADLGAISSGAETALEHGQGVELWLADWLVQKNGGEMEIEADDKCQKIIITVDAASPTLLSR